ncbi:MAG: aminoglycoside phosphotransferase family protein [Limnochordia bacterium]|nr:aminoglycoside phosphotransferase family protein [Limnochordia bacterium]
MNMSFAELRDWLLPVVGPICTFEPIGNHELKRHLVYKITGKQGAYVLKLYYKKNRWNREVANLRRFANTDVRAPRIAGYGVFESGVEWLVYDYIDGVILSHVEDELSQDNLGTIYFEMGKQLGLIHQYKCDFFGSMDENGNSIHGFVNFKAYFSHLTATILAELHGVEHDDPDLIVQAEARFLAMLDALDDRDLVATLCHNDFGPRNILVSEHGGRRSLRAVIDFEQSVPTDKDEELIAVYLPMLERNKSLAKSFRTGYELSGTIDMDRLMTKRKLYNLFRGLGICAWAKDVDYEYYLEGVRQLWKTV